MRMRDFPVNSRVPGRVQFKLPKIRQIMSFHQLSNPSVKERDNRLIFSVDLSKGANPMNVVSASDEISEFLGENVVVIDRKMQGAMEERQA